MPINDRLPVAMVASDHVPPAFREPSGRDELEDAKWDAEVYSLELKTSCIPGAGTGLFTKKGRKEGDLIGYYWGRFFFNREESTSNRVISTQKKRVNPTTGELETMFIDGSRRCAVTYINDPRGTCFAANATFIEDNFDSRRPIEGEITSPPLYTIMRAIAKMDIPLGGEILASYASNYFDDQGGSSPGEASPASDEASELPSQDNLSAPVEEARGSGDEPLPEVGDGPGDVAGETAESVEHPEPSGTVGMDVDVGEDADVSPCTRGMQV